MMRFGKSSPFYYGCMEALSIIDRQRRIDGRRKLKGVFMASKCCERETFLKSRSNCVDAL